MQDDVRYIQFSIIRDCLVKRLLGERYSVGFTFDEYQRLHCMIEYHRIAAFLHLAYLYSCLHGDERSGKTKLLHHPVKQLLAYPFFRREPHPTMPPCTENLFFAVKDACPHYFK